MLKVKQQVNRGSQKILNKSFYRFVFSFIAVVTGVLLFILVLGIGNVDVQ